jgi:hypothetical protein
MTVQILFAPVTNALGRPAIAMKASLCGAILFPVSFLVGAQFGLIGLAWAWLVAMPLLLIVTAQLSAPVIGVTLADIGRAVLPGLAPALVMAVAVGLIERALPADMAAPLRLAILVGAGGLIYPALLWLLEKEAIAEIKRLILRRPAPIADAA